MSLLVVTILQVPAQAHSVSFAHLEDDEKIVATLWMWGCSGYRAKYQLVFRPNPDLPGEAIVERRDVKGLWHQRLPSRTVSADDLRNLDLGVERYRVHSRGGCISTSGNRIRLKLVSDDEVIAEEMYFGNSCDVHLVPGALDLEDIVFDRDVDSEEHNTRPN